MGDAMGDAMSERTSATGIHRRGPTGEPGAPGPQRLQSFRRRAGLSQAVVGPAGRDQYEGAAATPSAAGCSGPQSRVLLQAAGRGAGG